MERMVGEPLSEQQRAYKRLLLANQDALEAREYLRAAMSVRRCEERQKDENVTFAAFVAAFTLSYGRCFAASRSGKRPLPSFKNEFEATLSSDQKTLHRRLKDLRDQEFAHSDADVADISVTVLDGRTLVPTSRVLRIYSLDANDLTAAAALNEQLVMFITERLSSAHSTLANSGGF